MILQAPGSARDPTPLVSGPIDGLIRLVSVVVGHGGGEPFLTRFLAVLVGILKIHADERGGGFNGRPFLRVLAGLVSELTGPDMGEAVSLR